jgi:hypothetical protein
LAKLLITSLIDDLDGSPAHETLLFSLDGAAYEIDLNGKHEGELRAALAKYISAGRKATVPRAQRRRTKTGTRPTAEQIRSWARDQGFLVKDSGPIQANIKAKYHAVHHPEWKSKH